MSSSSTDIRKEIMRALRKMPDERDTEARIAVKKSQLENLIEIFEHKLRTKSENMPIESQVEILDYLKRLVSEGTEITE